MSEAQVQELLTTLETLVRQQNEYFERLTAAAERSHAGLKQLRIVLTVFAVLIVFAAYFVN